MQFESGKDRQLHLLTCLGIVNNYNLFRLPITSTAQTGGARALGLPRLWPCPGHESGGFDSVVNRLQKMLA